MINGDEHIARSSSQFVYPFLLTFGGLFTFIDFSRGPKSIGDYVRSTVVHAQTVSVEHDDVLLMLILSKLLVYIVEKVCYIPMLACLCILVTNLHWI